MAADLYYLNKHGVEVPATQSVFSRMINRASDRRKLLETRLIYPKDRAVFADCVVRTWFLGVRPNLPPGWALPDRSYNWVSHVYPRELAGRSNIFAPNQNVWVFSPDRNSARYNHRIICLVMLRIAATHNLMHEVFPKGFADYMEFTVLKNSPARIATMNKPWTICDPFGAIAF